MSISGINILFLRIVSIVFQVIPATTLLAQFPQLYDGKIIPSYNSYLLEFSGKNYTLIFKSLDNIGARTIDWNNSR